MAGIYSPIMLINCTVPTSFYIQFSSVKTNCYVDTETYVMVKLSAHGKCEDPGFEKPVESACFEGS